MPGLTVVVPVYNVEDYLERCVDSVLLQNHNDFEAILVDDGSTDGDGAICDYFGLRDCRVSVIHQPNGGLSAARNTGISWALTASDSEWITFIDSDDWVHGCFLSIMLGAVNRFDADMSICNYIAVGSACEDLPTYDSVVLCKESEIAYVDPEIAVMPAWAKLYRKRLWTHHRFPVGRLHEDAFVTHEIIFEAKRVAVVHEQLYYYYQRRDSIMRSLWTPRRLDEIDAWEQRLSYLKANGYPMAHANDLPAFLWIAKEQLDAIPSGIEFARYRMRVKRCLLHHLNECKNLRFGQKLYYWHVAFPMTFLVPYKLIMALKRCMLRASHTTQ